jgi:hypothetical protein
MTAPEEVKNKENFNEEIVVVNGLELKRYQMDWIETISKLEGQTPWIG